MRFDMRLMDESCSRTVGIRVRTAEMLCGTECKSGLGCYSSLLSQRLYGLQAEEFTTHVFMQIHTLETGRFRLDGGAMFGIIPKPLWQRYAPPDDRNRIDLAMRCLLIEHENRLILVDNGIGDKYDPKFGDIFAVDHSTWTLDGSLRALGTHRDEITDVLITHLHFDHAGGTTRINGDTGRPEVAFPNARIWVQKSQLETAQTPNARERGSFLPENIEPIAAHGQLEVVDGPGTWLPDIELRVVTGHTEGMQLPVISHQGQRFLFCADLFPTHAHIPLPWVMAYDVRPLNTVAEKETFLPWIVEQDITLIFEHDPVHECGRVERTEKGFRIAETFPLKSVLS